MPMEALAAVQAVSITPVPVAVAAAGMVAAAPTTTQVTNGVPVVAVVLTMAEPTKVLSPVPEIPTEEWSSLTRWADLQGS
jgi:hypothetical protein